MQSLFVHAAQHRASRCQLLDIVQVSMKDVNLSVMMGNMGCSHKHSLAEGLRILAKGITCYERRT